MSSEPEHRRRRSWLRLALQVLAVGIVVSLLGLLIRQTVVRGAGSHLVSEVKSGGRPLAPQFELPVFWAHAETWPHSLRSAISDRRVAIDEVTLDGWDTHRTRSAFDDDRARANALVLAGWIVLRFTSRSTRDDVVEAVLAAFVQRRAA